MELLNYTGKPVGLTDSIGHPLRVLNSVGRARFETLDFQEVKKVESTVIYQPNYGKVLGLPKPDPNRQKLYIVNHDIADRIKNTRFDICVVAEPFAYEGGTFYRKVVNYS